MPVFSILRRPALLGLAVGLLAPAALASPILPWVNAQSRGLGYEPYFLSAIQIPSFDTGSANGVRYGQAVALDGDWLLVGAPDRLNGGGEPNGAVFLYQRQGADWVQRQRIQFGVGGAARCGQAVALVGNVALIGCPFFTSDGLSERGRMLVYRLDPAAGQLSLEETLLGAAPGEQCGHAVAVAGTGLANSTYAAMGCPGRDVVGAGSRGGVSVYRYFLNVGGLSWQAWGNLGPENEGNPQSAHWRFGAALAMERIAGDTPLVRLLVGMPGATPGGVQAAGLAFLYQRPASGGDWVNSGRLTRPGGNQASAEFGFAVGLSGDYLAIGAPGAGHDAAAARAGMAYPYARVESGGSSSWVSAGPVGADMARLNPSGGSRFGHAVAVSGEQLWVGQPIGVSQESQSAVWRYRVLFPNGAPSRLLTDIHQESLLRQDIRGAELGFALAVDRRTQRIAVGAPFSSFIKTFATGKAFVYQPADRLFADRFSPDHLRPGAQFRDCETCPTMLMVPRGSFSQGSPSSEPESENNERPQRQVTVPAFAIGQTSVTFAQWDACVADGGCSHDPADEGWGRGDRPVINVSWNDAQQYVNWLSNRTGRAYRLPSESEWEYAARAGSTGRFNTGPCARTDQANFRGNTPAQGCSAGINRSRSLPVASFAPNDHGLYDTHGNVWEWVQDCWNGGYVGAPTDGRPWTTGDCGSAVSRGGAWIAVGSAQRLANRNSAPRGDRVSTRGFRVARSISP